MEEAEHGEKHGYEIIVDRKPHNWPEPFISGAEIKRLAGVDQATFDAWQDVPGPEDILIADDQKVDLRKPGTEKFFTGKKTTTEG
jgi:hypothetical protein